MIENNPRTDELADITIPGVESLTYDSYLKVGQLLSLQQVQSNPPEHDELLFIVIHQSYELWFKQILHEFALYERSLADDSLMVCLRALERITVIQKVLNHQIDILETMTPNDFNRFRERLNPASGFQSLQFRLLEFKLGGKRRQYLKFFKNTPELEAQLTKIIAEPTIFDGFLTLLKQRGFSIPASVINRDVTQIYEGDDAVVAAIAQIYQNPIKYSDLYMTCERLIDIDEHLVLWRYRHIAMVERMIGQQIGTGGSLGVGYLATTLGRKFFPDLWAVRSYL